MAVVDRELLLSGSYPRLSLPVTQQGPIPQEISPCAPVPMLCDSSLEYKYNMDPTSLVLYAIELYDIRKDKEEAFECFVYVTPVLKTRFICD